jgi:hypothetical protein
VDSSPDGKADTNYRKSGCGPNENRRRREKATGEQKLGIGKMGGAGGYSGRDKNKN